MQRKEENKQMQRNKKTGRRKERKRQADALMEYRRLKRKE
jgi:hypothetical protein